MTARGVVTANGAITLGGTVEVTGAGPLNGTYPVTKVEHVYRTLGLSHPVRLGRPAVHVPRRHPRRRSCQPLGPSTAVSVIGQVTNINDPNNSGLVKVRFPGADQNEESGWARIVAVGGGPHRGNVFIPEVNDEVLVAFESGDLRQPVVIGGLYGSKTTMPSTQIEDGHGGGAGGDVEARPHHAAARRHGGRQPGHRAAPWPAVSTRCISARTRWTSRSPQGLAINIVAGNSSIKFGTDGSITLAGTTIAIKADQQITLSAPKVGITADGEVQVQSNGQLSAAGGDRPAERRRAGRHQGHPGGHQLMEPTPPPSASRDLFQDPGFIGRGLRFPMGVDHRGAIAMTAGPEDLDCSIRVVLATAPSERVMRPAFGCKIWDLLFEPVNANTVGLMAQAVREAVAQWEPRVEVEDVQSCPTRTTAPSCTSRSPTGCERPTTGATWSIPST